MTYTRAQLAAFAWLPADRSWRANDGADGNSLVEIGTMMAALMFGVPKPVERAASACFSFYRLTAAGIAERARLVENGEIE